MKLKATVPFVLQQAALLYEKELVRVKGHMKKQLRTRNSSRASPAARTVADSGGSLTASSSSSLKSDKKAVKGRRLLSQSRQFSAFKDRSGIVGVGDDDDDRLFTLNGGDSSSNDGALQREASSFTDTSQWSITFSALADAINDASGDMSSSASKFG